MHQSSEEASTLRPCTQRPVAAMTANVEGWKILPPLRLLVRRDFLSFSHLWAATYDDVAEREMPASDSGFGVTF